MASQNKRKRPRANPIHRWKEPETTELLETVAKLVKDNNQLFEKPTAQRFYEKFSLKSALLKNIDWRVMKAKMRYLKGTYISALDHLNKTGQIDSNDEEKIAQFVKKICPNWHLLELIYGQIQNINDQTIMPLSDNSCDKFYGDHQNEYIRQEMPGDLDGYNNDDEEDVEDDVPSETEDDMSAINDDNISIAEERDTSEEITPHPQNDIHHRHQQKRQLGADKQPNSLALLLEIQEKRLALEVKKFELEKEKAKNQVELKKLEFKKELEIRKMELDKEERIERERIKLQYESEERVRKYEIDIASKRKS